MTIGFVARNVLQKQLHLRQRALQVSRGEFFKQDPVSCPVSPQVLQEVQRPCPGLTALASRYENRGVFRTQPEQEATNGTKGIATRSKKLLVAPGITTRNKKLLGWRPSLVGWKPVYCKSWFEIYGNTIDIFVAHQTWPRQARTSKQSRRG